MAETVPQYNNMYITGLYSALNAIYSYLILQAPLYMISGYVNIDVINQ